MKRDLHRPLVFLSKAGFWTLLILIPFRLRLVLLERPIGTLYGDYTDFLLFPSQLALMFTLSVWLLDKTIHKQSFKPVPFFVTVPLIALTLISAISILASLDWQLSVYHVIFLVLLLGFVYYIVDNVRNPGDVALPIALQLAIQSGVGISQFLNQRDTGLQLAGEYVLCPATAGVSVVTSADQRWLRAYGLSDHPNILGGCLAFGLLLLLGHVLYAEKRKQIFIYLPLFIAGNIALFFTFSRSAWLAYGCGVGLLGVLAHRKYELLRRMRQIAILVVIVMLPLTVIFSELVATRLPFIPGVERHASEQQSLGERVILNDIAVQIFTENASLGTGIGTSPQAIRQQAPDLPTDYQPAHFSLLTAATEIGLFGVTVYALLLVAPWIAFAVNKKLRHSAAMQTVSMALLAVTIVGFFDYYPWYATAGRLWQFFIWGLWATTYHTTLSSVHDH